jgi:hypothetical protein
VISDAHPGLMAAIGFAMPGVARQRTCYLCTRVPTSAQPTRGHSRAHHP